MIDIRHIGFTGTQRGMTAEQVITVRRLLATAVLSGPICAHHGDCIGADAQFHDLVRELERIPARGPWIHVHPPSNPEKRAWREGDVMHCATPYLVRNREIVDSSHILIGTPGEVQEQQRSGTWSTLRYARKINRRRIIVWPDGSNIVHAEDGRCWQA